MTNEQENLQEEVLQEEDVSTSNTESIDQEQEADSTQEETVTLSKSEFTKLKRQAIAYKSQKENSPAEKKKSSSDINKDELYLVAKGYDDEAIAQLQVIARGSGTSLMEALENPLFKSYEAKQKEQERKAKAKLGASNGSGYSQSGPVIKPGMSDAEHRAVWEKLMSGK